MGNNIQVPYSGFIPDGLDVGTDVVISGRVLHHANRLSINLCEGPTYNEGCALHFNPRFDCHHVVRNHMQGGQWGMEESQGGMPFHKGHGFEVHMKVTPRGYKITVNNKHFCDFHHRIPKENVKYIYIEGEVAVNYIQFREKTRHPHPVVPGGRGGHGHHNHHPHGPGAHGFPSVPGFTPTPNYPPAPAYPAAPGYPPAPGYAPAPSYPQVPGYGPNPAFPGQGPMPVPGYPAGSEPIYSPPVPFTRQIPGGLYPGKIMYISGVPFPNPSRFTVNLMCGPSEANDISLAFDVRFRYGQHVNQVVRNHKQWNNWGYEDTQASNFPFIPSAPFEIMILAEPNCFKIAVNNQHFVEFAHRIQPIQQATHLNVTGDCQLTQVRFQ